MLVQVLCIARYVLLLTYEEANICKCNIIIPTDCLVSETFEGTSISKNINNIKKNDIILDIGPKTIKIIEEVIDV